MALPIQVDAQPSARPEFSHEAGKGALRVREMVQHAERVNEIERVVGERQRQQIRLNAIDVAKIRNISRRLIDGPAEVDGDDAPRVASDLPRVPAHAAAGVEDELAAQRREIDPLKVVVEIGLAGLAPVVEVRPLVAEAGLRAPRGFIRRHGHEPWNTVNDWHAPAARGACKRAGAAVRCRGFDERRPARWTAEKWEEIRTHYDSVVGSRTGAAVVRKRRDHATSANICQSRSVR